MNDSFTQVLELAGGLGLRQIGNIPIGAASLTKALVSPDKVVKHRYVKVQAMRRARGGRLEVRRWQKLCGAVFGTLKTQRSMNSFRMRSLPKSPRVRLAALAYNVTRLRTIR